MAEELHGMRFIRDSTGVQPVVDATMTNIGLVGTAGDGVDNAVWPQDEPVQVFTHEREKLLKLGDGGTLADAFDAIIDQGVRASVTVVRTGPGANPEEALTNIVGDSAAMTGIHALEHAPSHLGETPNILVAPGFTSQRPDGNANPVVAEMLGLADKLEAVVIADGPDTDRDGALDWRRDFSSDRLIMVDPHVKVYRDGVTHLQPVSARIAGIGVKRDKLKGGPFHSWSNQPIQGITGLSRPISYFLSDPSSEANWLNTRGISTIFRETGDLTGGEGGYTFWGSKSLTDDKLWQFYNVRRGRDFIHKSLRRALKQYIGRENIEAHAVTAVMETIRSFLANLVANNKIIGFEVGMDKDKNSPGQLRLGKLRIEMYAEEAAPIYQIDVGSHRHEVAYETLIGDILRNSTALAA